MDVTSLFNTTFNLPVVPVSVDPLSTDTQLLSPAPVPLVPTTPAAAAFQAADSLQVTSPTAMAAAASALQTEDALAAMAILAEAPAPSPAVVDPTTPVPAPDVVDPVVLSQVQELDLATEAILDAQSAQLSAMRSGAADPAQILSGLPPGASATLMGGGWISAFPDRNPWTSDLAASFFHARVVDEVSPTAKVAPAGGETRNTAGGEAALEAYGQKKGSHGPTLMAVGQDFKSIPPAVDLLD
jgi:hypothetical protein